MKLNDLKEIPTSTRLTPDRLNDLDEQPARLTWRGKLRGLVFPVRDSDPAQHLLDLVDGQVTLAHCPACGRLTPFHLGGLLFDDGSYDWCVNCNAHLEATVKARVEEEK